MILPSTDTDSLESVPGHVFILLFTCEPTTNLGSGIIKSVVFWAALALSRSLAAFSYSCCCFLFKFSFFLGFLFGSQFPLSNYFNGVSQGHNNLKDINLKLIRTLFMIYWWIRGILGEILQPMSFLNYLHFYQLF